MTHKVMAYDDVTQRLVRTDKNPEDIGGGGGGGVEFQNGGVTLQQALISEPVTIASGESHFHPRMIVGGGELITVSSGGYLLTKSDTITGTVTVDPGGLWEVL